MQRDTAALITDVALLAMRSSTAEASAHQKSVALMKFLAKTAMRLGVAKHVYVVGGAVRDFYIDRPIKDIDIVIDSVALSQKKTRDSEWFANQLLRVIPTATNLSTNQYGVAILTVKGEWIVDGENLREEQIEIANARKESYGGDDGKGYKPHMVKPATIDEDVSRREFTYNTLLWSLYDLAKGPDKAKILDLTGRGIKDLNEGILRTPVNPDKTFRDDPTRMLRAIKFVVRYGHKLSPDAEKSIKKNADALKNVPPNAIATLLMDVLLNDSNYKKSLVWMKKLGILDVLSDIIRTDKNFRSTLDNWMHNKRVLFMFDMMDVGLPLGMKIGFLSKDQQERLRNVAITMDEGEPERLLAILKQPGKIVDMKSLIRETGLKGSKISVIQDIAREEILIDPELVDNKSRLTNVVRQELSKRGKLVALVDAALEVQAASDMVYAGAFLDDRSHKILLDWWKKNVVDTLSEHLAHHVTLARHPDDNAVQWTRGMIGRTVTLQVVGYAADEKVQVVAVKGVWSTNKIPHVTVAIAPSTDANYSNDLLARGFKKVRGPKLKTKIGYSNSRKEVITAGSKRELHLFDFDGTMFKSPPPPAWWEDHWWSDAKSLSPPCVPQKPGSEWWVSTTVRDARKSIRDQNVWAICCTGRGDKDFRWRVPELLKGANLIFDEVFLSNLSPSATSTNTFKKRVMEKLHAVHKFTVIHIWEDKDIGDFKQFVEKKLGVACVTHPVQRHERPALCSSPP